jgi:uncharacterized membrane protein
VTPAAAAAVLVLPADVDLSLIISFQRMRDVLKVGLLQQWHQLMQTAADSQTTASIKPQEQQQRTS